MHPEKWNLGLDFAGTTYYSLVTWPDYQTPAESMKKKLCADAYVKERAFSP